MRETGFGPAQALSHRILSPAHLTNSGTPAFKRYTKQSYKKLVKLKILTLLLSLTEEL